MSDWSESAFASTAFLWVETDTQSLLNSDKVEESWLGVSIPEKFDGIFRSWCRTLSMADYRFVGSLNFWLFAPSMRKDLLERFIGYGLVLEEKKPARLGGPRWGGGGGGGGDSFSPQGPSPSGGGDKLEGQTTKTFASEYLEACEILGLSPHAPEEVVKAAFRALQRKHHPDKQLTDGRSSSGIDAEAKRINSAMDTIKQHRSW